MGKKIMRKGYGGSKGLHSSNDRASVVAARAARHPLDVMAGIHSAWRQGKNPWLTVENPLKTETNKPFIRVKANDYWGKPSSGYMVGSKQTEGAAA